VYCLGKDSLRSW